MGIDIEANHVEQPSRPPGTIQLEKRKGIYHQHGNLITNWASVLAKDIEIVLHPRPTSDPDDPLNWSKFRKYLNFFLVCFYAMSDISSRFWFQNN